MTLRTIVLISSLAMVLGGCVVAPAPHAHRHHYDDRDYYYSDDDYYDYQATPAYEGYYYVRVIFIGATPYYVDDHRHLRPIPPHMHDHFRNSPYRNKDRHAPVFSRDREVRDGYQMSRVVYLNNVPHYVEDGRVARPLPNHMHERFRSSPFTQSNGSADSRQPPPAYGRDTDRNQPPAYGRDTDRNQPPTYGRDADRNQPPAYGRNADRNQPPAYGRDADRNQPPAYGRDVDRNQPPAYGRDVDRHQPPFVLRERMNAGQPQREAQRFDAPPSSNSNRPAPQGNRNDARPAPTLRAQPSQPQAGQRNNAAEPRRDAPFTAGRTPKEMVQQGSSRKEAPAKDKESEKDKDAKQKERDDDTGKKSDRD